MYWSQFHAAALQNWVKWGDYFSASYLENCILNEHLEGILRVSDSISPAPGKYHIRSAKGIYTYIEIVREYHTLNKNISNMQLWQSSTLCFSFKIIRLWGAQINFNAAKTILLIKLKPFALLVIGFVIFFLEKLHWKVVWEILTYNMW